MGKRGKEEESECAGEGGSVGEREWGGGGEADGREGRKREWIDVWIDNNRDNLEQYYYSVEDPTIVDGVGNDEMIRDMTAEEDEILHGENCWTQSEIIQMSFNNSCVKIQIF